MNTIVERLKELEAKATHARWTHDASGYIFQVGTGKEIDDDQGFKDAALIVEMRNSLPKLLAVFDAAYEMNVFCEEPMVTATGLVPCNECRKCILRIALAALEETK